MSLLNFARVVLPARAGNRTAQLLAGLITLSATAGALAGDPPLTLAASQQMAVARSRQLAGQDQAVFASREMAIAAGRLPDPILKFGIDNLPVDGADKFSVARDFMTMRRVGVMQELTRSDKRQVRAERYQKTADKSLAEKDVVIAAIQRDTALAWLDRYYAEQIASAIAEQVAQARLEIQSAESAYRGGRGSQAELFAARSTLSAIEDRASEAQRKVRNAKTMLARWSGAASDAPLAGAPMIDTIRLDPAVLDTQLSHHPDLTVLSMQEEIAKTDVRLAEAEKKSDWTVEVAYQLRGPAYSNMLSVGFSLPLQWDQKNRQDRELSSKLALAAQAHDQRDEMLRTHVAETRVMINEWENDRERLSRYRRELLPLARERTQALVAAWRGGKSSLSELLAARRNEVDVRVQALQLNAEAARLWAQINFLFPDDATAQQPAHTMSMETK